MQTYGISFEPYRGIGTVVYLALDGKFEGTVVISDTIKEQAPETIRLLKQSGVKKTVMLTGDKKRPGRKRQKNWESMKSIQNYCREIR